jgi:NADH-quinone oxidoreductase subunit J
MSLLWFIFPVSLFTFIVAVFLSKNPVYGVLSFVAVVMHVVILLILLDLEFLAYVLAIVYIGAIVVLFLFVIMMFYIHHFKTPRSMIRGIVEYYFLGWILSNLAYYWVFYTNTDYVDFTNTLYHNNLIYLIAWYFFNDAMLLTILVAVIMLIGIIGAIILTVKTTTLRISPLIRIRNSILDVLIKKK